MSEYEPYYTSEARTQEITLFDYEDLLSEEEIERLWLDNMFDLKNSSTISDGEFTIEAIIEHTAQVLGLRIPPDDSPLLGTIRDEAFGIISAEEQERERDRAYVLDKTDVELNTINTKIGTQI